MTFSFSCVHNFCIGKLFRKQIFPIRQKKDLRFEWNFMEKRHEIVSFVVSLVLNKLLSNIQRHSSEKSSSDDVVSGIRTTKKRKVAKLLVKFKRKLHNIFHSTLHTFSPSSHRHHRRHYYVVHVEHCFPLHSFSPIFCSHVQKLFYAFQLCSYILHSFWWVWKRMEHERTIAGMFSRFLFIFVIRNCRCKLSKVNWQQSKIRFQI